jgi:acyl transferase domain-containing protein
MAGSPHETDHRALLARAVVRLDELQARLDATERTRHEPIAIIGVACRMPGGANDPEALWALLRDGVDAIREVPADRWDADGFYDPTPGVPGKTYTRCGGFVDQVDLFDPAFFRVAPREAAAMDPQHRVLLEVAWEALERAGLDTSGLAGSRTGVYLGISTNDYAHLATQTHGTGLLGTYFGAGVSHSIAAGRISYLLGLHGPSLAVDTACSSSLMALHLACQSLRLGECSLALVGGVNLMLSPLGMIATSQARMLAADGRCKTFDASADGYGRSEGCAVVVLRRLSDAVAAKDNILAVIRGSAANQDGRSQGLTAPNRLAQEAVLREALADARLSPSDISYVEAHGTGTPLGDPIEVEALGAVLGEGRAIQRPLLIGSIKSNIGHLEAAAGVAGLLKLVLALDHEELPPHLHFTRPNPHIPWETLPVRVTTTRRPWRRGDGPRIAGLSSFGFSGTNVHVIVAEAPEAAAAVSAGASERPLHVLVLSGRTERGLAELAGRFERHLASPDAPPLADVAFSAATGRAHFNHRAAVVAGSAAQAREALAAAATGRATPRLLSGRADAAGHASVVFLFTGQGSQYAGMGRELYETEPVFRAALDRCAALLRDELPRPLLSVLYHDGGPGAALDDTAYTQPALFALEYALAELWRAWGVEPAFVIGHSLGEYVAACVAGVMTLEDALTLVAVRGRLMQTLSPAGAMAAVLASEERVRSTLAPYGDRVAIAAVNGPTNVVVSGAADAVGDVVGRLAAEGVRSRPLTTSRAFHSSLMDPVLDPLARAAAAIEFRAPRVALVSNVTGQVVDDRVLTPAYWVRHAREAVRFADGVRAIHRGGGRIFVEVGPHPVLLGMAREVVGDDANGWLPSLRRGKDAWAQILETVAALHVGGVDIDWKAFDRGRARRRVTLPTSPLQRERYWLDDGGSKPLSTPEMPVHEPLHPLIGRRVHTAIGPAVFEARVNPAAPEWLSDHRIHGITVFPAAAYVEMARLAGTLAAGEAQRLGDLDIHEAMLLNDGVTRSVQVVVSSEAAGRSVKIFSREVSDVAGPWNLHASGRLDRAGDASAESLSVPDLTARCPVEMSRDDCYESFRRAGVEYGPSFALLDRIWRGPGQAVARLRPSGDLAGGSDVLHPGVLDAGLQLFGPALHDVLASSSRDDVYLPVAIGSLTVAADGRPAVWTVVHLTTEAGADTDVAGDLALLDERGGVIARARGVRFRRTPKSMLDRVASRALEHWLYELTWNAEPGRAAGRAAVPGVSLIFMDDGGLGEALAARLVQRGERCVRVRRGATYESSGADDVWLDPDQPEHFGRLVTEVERTNGTPPVRVVHLWGLDASLTASGDTTALETAQALACGSALHLAQSLLARPSVGGLWLVTRGGQAVQPGDGAHPMQSALWGLGRVVALEHPDLRCVRLDLDPTAAPSDVAALLDAIDDAGDEDQVAVRRGVRYVARLARSTALRRAGNAAATAGPVQLAVPGDGILDHLTPAPADRRRPGRDEVEIRVRAAGLNFRDVLNALGMYPGAAGPLGSECAGTIVAVGDDTEGFAVGDEVIALAPSCFGTFVTTSTLGVVHRPPALDVHDAAGMPVVFMTAEYGLNRLAKMTAGDRVLVHAAAGGVGLAAVQLAQRAGAEVFATAGSPEKRAFLESLGVRHVMDSRSLSFADDIRTRTTGEGVDIVLNSLAGEFIPASLSVLRRGGRFLEIGKRGVWDNHRVAQLRPDVRYWVYDLAAVLQADPAGFRAMLVDLTAAFGAGALTPLPRRVFRLDDVASAFRFMAKALHIGKIVVGVSEGHAAAARSGDLRDDATYLVTGGLGGLGLAVAAGLVDHGARHLVLVGRREPSPEAARKVEDLTVAGARVVTVQADVSDRARLEQVLAEMKTTMPPLRGVVHAAGVLDDGVLRQQTWERFARVLAPKATGAWHLHELTRDAHLDFFVLFSSLAALVGAPGQANYAAANAFLDGLAHHRRAEGLAALSINWGAWADIGMAAALDTSHQRRRAAGGIGLMAPSDGVRAFEALRTCDLAQAVVAPIDWPAFLRQFPPPGAPRFFALMSHGERRGTPDTVDLTARLAGIDPESRLGVLVAHVTEQVVRVIGLDASAVDTQQPLTEMGLDSLMAVELKNRLEAGAGQPLPASLAFDHPTVEALATFLAETVFPTTGGPVEVGVGTDGSAIDGAAAETLLARLDEFSESEVDALLERLREERGTDDGGASGSAVLPPPAGGA